MSIELEPEPTTIAQVGPVRLMPGALSHLDIAASTMANIAPAMSFFFGFGLIAAIAGVASPLTIVVAIVAIALLGNTLTEFSRSHPSTGSFVTFVGRSFGPYSAVVTAVVLACGYILAVASVVCISGASSETILHKYLSITVPWQLLSAVLTLASLAMIVRGVGISTKVASLFFAFEFALLVAISVVLMASNGAYLNLHPFDPGRLSGGFSGLSLGFPLAVYMFLGWENSASLAEETRDPRRGIARAVVTSVLLLGTTYLLLAYATVVAYHDHVKALTGASVPFVDATHGLIGVVAFLAYIAGFTSTSGALLSATNSQARIIFNSGREGLLPSWCASVTRHARTPWAAFVVMLGLALGVTYVFGWSTDPVAFFGEIGTVGTILVALTYLVANLALPVYYRRHHPAQLHLVRHVILPLIGAVAIGFPLYELVKPGQPAPFDRYPWIVLGIVVAGALWAFLTTRHDPTLGDRVGSLVADELRWARNRISSGDASA